MSAEMSENLHPQTPSPEQGRVHPLDGMDFEEVMAPVGASGGCVGESFAQLLDDASLKSIIPKIVSCNDIRKLCRIYDLILIESTEQAMRHLEDAPDDTPMIVALNRGSSPYDLSDRREMGHYVFTRDAGKDFQGVEEIMGIIIKRSSSYAESRKELS